MEPFDYLRPNQLTELAQILQQPEVRIVAGGTDVIPQLHSGRINVRTMVDISRVSELRYLHCHPQCVEIGALTTFAEIAASPFLAEHARTIVEAAEWVGAPMTRQRGTLGGNLANASPAADSIPALMVLDASIALYAAARQRTMRLEKFFVGPGKTVLQPDEMIHHVTFSPLTPGWGSAFIKRGPRHGMTIAIISAAAAVEITSEGVLKAVRVAVGAVAPTVVRLYQAESLLAGRKLDEIRWDRVETCIGQEISPIDDIRASQTYRQKAVVVLVQRTLEKAIQDAWRRSA